MLGRWYSRLAFSLEFLAFKMFTVASGKGVWRFCQRGVVTGFMLVLEKSLYTWICEALNCV